MLEEFDNPILQAAAKSAVEARPARPDDATSDVLVVGEGFFYLGVDDNDEFFKFATVPDGAPAQVVIDADSFLRGLTPTTMTFLALRELDGLVFKINTAGLDAETL